MKILIIDDERSIRNSLGEILTDEGYDVDVAEDGAMGCAMAEKEKYNIIFCDIKMPGMDGIEVLDRLNEMETDSAVVMTVNGISCLHEMHSTVFIFIHPPFLL